MKAQLVKRLSKKYLLPNLPGFDVKGPLLYRQDLQYLLQGFCFESSAFSRDRFTIYVFVQPLYIPSTYLFFNFGDRISFLSKGRDIWWEYDEAHENEIMDEVLATISHYGVPFLEERKSLEKFIHRYKKYDPKGNPHIIEGVCYAYVLTEDYIKARSLLSSFIRVLADDIREAPTITWIVEMQTRAQSILGYLENQDFISAKEQLDQWKSFTLTKLGLQEKQ